MYVIRVFGGRCTNYANRTELVKSDSVAHLPHMEKKFIESENACVSKFIFTYFRKCLVKDPDTLENPKKTRKDA